MSDQIWTPEGIEAFAKYLAVTRNYRTDPPVLYTVDAHPWAEEGLGASEFRAAAHLMPWIETVGVFAIHPDAIARSKALQGVEP